MGRPKRAAVRKEASEAKEDEVVAPNPASRSGRNKAVESKAGPSGGSGDHVAVPPKGTNKGAKSKITVSKGRVKLPEKKVDQDVDSSDSTGSSPEAGNSKAMPPTPYPARIDFSSSPENSDDGMQEEVEKPPKKVASKATTTTTKAKGGSKKAEEPMEDDKASDKEEANGNVSGPKDEDVEKLENTTKKTKPVAKKVTAKAKVGSKRAAPRSPTKTGAAGPKGKKTAVEEVKGQGAEKRSAEKGPRAAAKGTSKEALSADKKPAGGKVIAPPAKHQDAFDDSLSNDSAEIIDASSDKEGNNAAPMHFSSEILLELRILELRNIKFIESERIDSRIRKLKQLKAGLGKLNLSSTLPNRSGSDSGSANEENDLDVVMDNLQIISEESGPENAAAESEPTPEPPKKRAAATRKKQPELPATSKPKAGPSAANRGTKNRTLPANSAQASAEDMKKSLLAHKSYTTRSKVKAKAGTSAMYSTAATTKTKK